MPEVCELEKIYAKPPPIHPAWIQTLYSGAVDLVDPKPEQIVFSDIAVALARQPRFAGHTVGLYSVAQHLVAGAEAIIRDTGRYDWAAYYLLHDAHEAYIGDDTSPKTLALVTIAEMIKGRSGGKLVRLVFKELKLRLDVAIHTAAHLIWPYNTETMEVVKLYDLRMCRTERDWCMDTPPYPWADTLEAAALIPDADMSMWSEDEAADRWLKLFKEIV